MTYVFGHELGHYILPCRGLFVRLPNGTPVSMEDAISFRKLEILMDRFGMVACQDYETAAVAFLKLHSGLGSQHITDDVVSFAKEAIPGIVEDYTEYQQEAFSSHPSLYARIRALSHFSESVEYLKLIDKKDGKPQSEIDDDVEKDFHAALDYYPGNLMDFIYAVNNHLAAIQVDHEGKCELSIYSVHPHIKPDENNIRSILSKLQKMPAEKKSQYVSNRLVDHIRNSVVRCPSRMEQHMEALFPRLAGAKFHEIAQSFAPEFKLGLIRHRAGEHI